MDTRLIKERYDSMKGCLMQGGRLTILLNLSPSMQPSVCLYFSVSFCKTLGVLECSSSRLFCATNCRIRRHSSCSFGRILLSSDLKTEATLVLVNLLLHSPRSLWPSDHQSEHAVYSLREFEIRSADVDVYQSCY